MLDLEAETSKRVLAEIAKEGTRDRLFRMAQWSTHAEAEADDLVQDSLCRVLDPDDSPWVSLEMSFLTHMSFVMRDTWKNKLRKAMATELPDAGVTADEKSLTREPAADEALNDLRRVATWRMLGQRLLVRIEGKHPIAAQSFKLGAQGIDDAEEQARIIGCSIDDIYEAQRTLKRNGEAVRKEWELEEERRMRALRAKTTKNPEGDEDR